MLPADASLPQHDTLSHKKLIISTIFQLNIISLLFLCEKRCAIAVKFFSITFLQNNIHHQRLALSRHARNDNAQIIFLNLSINNSPILPLSNNQQPTTNNQQPTTNNQQPTTNN
jgi:hypothetical protein